MQKALVLGKGKSGNSAKELLVKLGYDVQVMDSEEVSFDDICGLSLLCVSPGISKEIEIIKKAESCGIDVCGELELGFKFLSCKCIAVTGTNGKTTTTSLIGDICSRSKTTFVGGNIGTPITSFCLDTKREDICVLEVSSFQAETFKYFKPFIGVFLNFGEDHLNRHNTLDCYFREKTKVFSNQRQSEYAVINYDDIKLRQFSCELQSNVYYFSLKKKVKGCYLAGGNIYFNDGKTTHKIMNMPENVSEQHNKQNVLAAVLACLLSGVEVESIKNGVINFKKSEHRLEVVTAIKGVQFINDSKSTNIASTLAAIKSFKQKQILIMGGSDKGYNFSDFFNFLPNRVRGIFVVGETSKKITEAAKIFGYKNIVVAESLEVAAKTAFKVARKGEKVLLSPACASFDMFDSYAHRGNEFKRIVWELKNEICKNECKKE